jgi:hypothetical protein
MAISVEIEKVVLKETITIQTPFYYKHDLMLDECDSVIYGKVTDDCIVTVHKSERYSRDETEFEFNKELRPHFQSSKSYLTEDEYRSNKEEYESVIEEMKRFIEREA